MQWPRAVSPRTRNHLSGWLDSGKSAVAGTEKILNAGLFSVACRHRCVRTWTFLHRNYLWRPTPPTMIATITEVSAELASASHTGDFLAVNTILKGHIGKCGTGKNQKKGQICWYHGTFGDDSRYCSGPLFWGDFFQDSEEKSLIGSNGLLLITSPWKSVPLKRHAPPSTR